MSEMNTTTKNLKTVQGNNAANTLDAFVFEKTQKVNDVLVEAQRLINLYRQIKVFGPDFVSTFDKMLLSSKPDVQLALSNLSGGDTVRQYLKFLQNRMQQETDLEESENNSISEDAASYLPSPDEVPPFQMTSTVTVNGNGESTLAQPDVLNTLIQEISASQQKTMNEMIERMMREQTKLLSDSLSAVLHNTQKIAQEQVQNISSLIASGSGSAYPHVEEYVEPEDNSVRSARSVRPLVEPKKGKYVRESHVVSPVQSSHVSEDVEILSEIDLPTDNL